MDNENLKTVLTEIRNLAAGVAKANDNINNLKSDVDKGHDKIDNLKSDMHKITQHQLKATECNTNATKELVAMVCILAGVPAEDKAGMDANMLELEGVE